MDGYAVRAVDTLTATETHPLQLELGAQAQYVDTGDPLPAWADAVIMIENVQPIGSTRLEIRAPIAPWTAVRPLGEDMVATELVLARQSRPAPCRSRCDCGQRPRDRQCAPPAARRGDPDRHRVDHRRARGRTRREARRHHRIQLDRAGGRSGAMGRGRHALSDRDRRLRSDQSHRARRGLEARSGFDQRRLIRRQRRLHRAHRARTGHVARAWHRRSPRSSGHSGHGQSAISSQQRRTHHRRAGLSGQRGADGRDLRRAAVSQVARVCPATRSRFYKAKSRASCCRRWAKTSGYA